MLFTSLTFVIFLPLTLGLFALAPPPWRWALLLLASLVFYGWLGPAALLSLGVLALWVLVCARQLAHSGDETQRRRWLVLGLVVVIGSLVALKFYDFVAGELQTAWTGAPSLPKLGWAAPAGFSFYAFAGAALLVDLYARRVDLPRHSGHTLLYLAWFPKVLAGPIERAGSFFAQLQALSLWPTDPALVKLGWQLILWGLVKKVVIADNLAPLVDKAFAIPAFATPVDLLLAVYLFAFQIYCDFSGYTDIAIGVSMLFGIRLMDNFRRPYLARSTAEFWGQRWHISLGRWFRDYLYLPLGGSRHGVLRQGLNVMLVFVASGLWHAGLGYGVGWTFLVWGALNGVYQWAGLASRMGWQRLAQWLPAVAGSPVWALLRVLLTFHLILLSWVFFRAKTLADAQTVLQRLWHSLAELPALLANYPWSADQITAAVLIVLLLVVEWLDEKRSIFERLAAAPVALRWATWYAAMALLLLLGRWQQREFIYMQF